MADPDPSLHHNQSGSSQIFAHTALALYGTFLSGVEAAAYPLHPGYPHLDPHARPPSGSQQRGGPEIGRAHV